MNDVALGFLAVLVGAIFCFRGYLTMRIIIPIWGAFTGFMLGSGLIANVTDDGILSTWVGWLVGILVGLLFGTIAYLYFEVSVVLAMSSVGFVLGTSLMVALDVTWTWLIVLVGVVAGVALAYFAIVGDLPMVVLIALTALAGGSTIVGGVMLMTGVFDVSDLDDVTVVQRIDDAPGWWALYVLLAVVGIVVQTRMARSLTATLREEWAASSWQEQKARGATPRG